MSLSLVKSQIEAAKDFEPGSSWPEPLPLLDVLPVQPFSADMLPKAFRPWIVDIAERMDCPMDFPAVTVMVAAGAVIGRKIAIKPKALDSWKVVANLWGMNIGRPSVKKSPSVEEALKPLYELEAGLVQENRARVAEYQEAMAAYQLEKKQREKQWTTERRKRGREAADQYLKENPLPEPPEPIQKSYIINDATVEAVGVILSQNPNGVLLYRDELPGLLNSFEKKGYETARAFYLEAWKGNAPPYKISRKTAPEIRIEKPCLSILGNIQPGPLTTYVQQAREAGTGADGFLQRFQLAVYPDVSAEVRLVDRLPDTEAQEKAFQAFRRLAALETPANDSNDLPVLQFTAEAQERFNQWLSGLLNRLRGEEEALEAHFSKYQSLVPSLALIDHLASVGTTSPVPLASLERAIAWADYLETHARRIYSLDTGGQNVDPEAKVLLFHIQKGDLESGFTQRDVMRKGWARLKAKHEVEAAIHRLLENDWLEERRLGKTTAYDINPKAFQ